MKTTNVKTAKNGKATRPDRAKLEARFLALADVLNRLDALGADLAQLGMSEAAGSAVDEAWTVANGEFLNVARAYAGARAGSVEA